MTFDVDAFQRQLPYYLTAGPAQKAFITELKSLLDGAHKGYFIPEMFDPFNNEMLQGDGWRGFQIFSFATASLNETQGIVLSNSCDVSAENHRALPPRVTFAPIVKLSRIRDRFEKFGLRADQIEPRLQAIRAQSVTSIFYLPSEGPLFEEHVALLDGIHSMPVEVHRAASKKLFTLTMAGFYLLVFKLSVHFCRLQENVDRRPTEAGA